MTPWATLANLAWAGASAPSHRRFVAALEHPERAQESLLSGYLRRNRETAFGRLYGFETVRTVREFQERVPLAAWDDFEPFVDRIAAGEAHVLTRERVRLFEPTGGSTRAAKWVPFTAGLQAELRRALGPWLLDLLAHRPSLAGGPAYWSITPPADAPPRRPSRVPVGFEADAAYLGGALRRLVERALVAPEGLRRVRAAEDFRRATRVCLLRCRDLRLISVWHPSLLSSLLGGLEPEWDELVADVRRGLRLPEAGVTLPPAPGRARELAALGPGSLPALWPRLGLVSCWCDGHAATCLPELRRLLPGVEIQPKGLLATEGWVSIPFRGTTPLAVTAHFFELLDEQDRPHLAHEVSVGHSYSVVLTTAGGLYRYRLLDRVEVTGFLGRTPCLRFLGKEDHVSDLSGEKLSEGFVAQVLRGVLAGLAPAPRFSLLAPEVAARPPCYVLFLDAEGPLPDDLAHRLDAALQENPGYRQSRRLGQLAPARVATVAPGAWERYSARLVAEGRRLGDLKPSPLSPWPGWRGVLGAATPAPPA